MTNYCRFSFLLFVLTTFAHNRVFNQSTYFDSQEDKFIKLYSRLLYNPDSIDIYSDKFGRDFKAFIKSNPATLAYPFKKLVDSYYMFIRTSADGNFRVYSWDTWTGGTMHFFNEIYQWTDKGKVFVKILKYEEGDPGGYCSRIYTTEIKNKKYYLTISNGTYSTKDASKSISAFTIDNGKLVDTVKIFRTKTKKLNSINVEFDFFSEVDKSERPLELITYDDKLKIVYIPVVDDKGQVTNRNILYELNDVYFEFTNIETGKRK